MDFSSLVLMEKDKDTGFITKELGSFQVSEGALFVKKLFSLPVLCSLSIIPLLIILSLMSDFIFPLRFFLIILLLLSMTFYNI